MTIEAFVANMAVAFVLGVLIGLERQWRQHTAGLRTDALVALGAALLVGLSTLIDHETSPTRIAAPYVWDQAEAALASDTTVPDLLPCRPHEEAAKCKIGTS